MGGDRKIDAAHLHSGGLAGGGHRVCVVLLADEDGSASDAPVQRPRQHGSTDRAVVFPFGDQRPGTGAGDDENPIVLARAVEQSRGRFVGKRLVARLGPGSERVRGARTAGLGVGSGAVIR